MPFFREVKTTVEYIRVTVIQFVISGLETVAKELDKGLEKLQIGRRTEAIRKTAIMRSLKIEGRVLVNMEDLLSLWFQ